MTNEPATIFETKIWNRRREQVRVYDSNGRVICLVDPNQIEIIESANDKTLYARYSEVVFEENGTVSLTVRPECIEPVDQESSLLILENIDGKDLEQRLIGGKTVFIPKGIPVRVRLDSTDPNAVNARITIKKIAERIKCPDWPGYWAWRETVKDVPTPRPQQDPEALKPAVPAIEVKE